MTSLALWDSAPAHLSYAGMTHPGQAQPFAVERHPPAQCAELLHQAMVDVALLPSFAVCMEPEDYDVLAAGALSAWCYPMAQLVLHQGWTAPVRQVVYDPAYPQERWVAQVILQEHYGMKPSFIPLPEATPIDLLHAEADGCVLVTPSPPPLDAPALTLDLGQEWYEMAQYPLVLGLFVTRRDEGRPDMVEALVEVTEVAEALRPSWLAEAEIPAVMRPFYKDHLRLRLDDLVIASLTEQRQLMFYEGLLDNIDDLRLTTIPNPDNEPDDLG
ncbi:MAG: MqnA/MqnD/SBP family protein [Bacteroidota bacterium]